MQLGWTGRKSAGKAPRRGLAAGALCFAEEPKGLEGRCEFTLLAIAPVNVCPGSITVLSDSISGEQTFLPSGKFTIWWKR